MTKNHRQRDMCTALKHNLANHKNEEDGVVETSVTQLVDNTRHGLIPKGNKKGSSQDMIE
jgi:hypothetical protein